MEATEPCEIARLPEELLSAVISFTTPRDALRTAAVCRAFRAAADSDAVWSCFLPRDLPPLAARELRPALSSKRAQFRRLSNRRALLADGRTSVWLDRETGVKCYMLSARALNIAWGNTPLYWRWIPINDSSFKEAAELLRVCWLEICGKIRSKMLTPDSAYAAYIVFKMAHGSYGLATPVQEASVCTGESRLTRQVSVQGFQHPHIAANVLFPQKRADGWMELEMGAFYNEQGKAGEVSISLRETNVRFSKKGIIVQGIEVRAKK